MTSPAYLLDCDADEGLALIADGRAIGYPPDALGARTPADLRALVLAWVVTLPAEAAVVELEWAWWSRALAWADERLCVLLVEEHRADLEGVDVIDVSELAEADTGPVGVLLRRLAGGGGE